MFRRSLLVMLAMSPVVAAAADIEHHFVRITVPRETDKYSTSIANVAGIGYCYFVGGEWKPDDLRIRVRLYRPANGDFELLQEEDAEIGPLLEDMPAVLQFRITVTPKIVPKPGKYLFRVDCLDKTGKEERLLASNSVFLTFVGKNEPGVEAGNPRPARTRRVSRISRRFR